MDKIKQVGLALLMIVIIASIAVNIKKQTESLAYARSENAILALSIANQEYLNKSYRQTLEYIAKNPNYWEQQARDKFGLGSENDYWINIQDSPNIDLYPEVNYQENKLNWVKWLEVFTK